MPTLQTTQRRASYFIIGMVMWEFFSFYGMQALLILYLTQKLHFKDELAYSIFGGFTSLIYVTPIIGGWLADKYCGYRYATIWGCLLIVAGHMTLGTLSVHSLYLGLTLLILGIGLFKSNAICLIGDCYPNDSVGRSAALTWYYVSGNIGAVAAQLLCPYLAQSINWSIGFLAAAIGMLLGIVLLLLSRPYFRGWYHAKLSDTFWKRLSWWQQTLLALVLLGISLVMMLIVLYKLWVGVTLIVILLISLVIYVQVYRASTKEQRHSLRVFALFCLFGCGFWVFDQQGSSSIILFISRFTNRQMGEFLIPAGSFNAINPAVVLVIGSMVAWLWRILGRHHLNPNPQSKVSVGLFLLAGGFYMIAFAAHIAQIHNVAFYVPALGLALNGAAEIFIDPVILANLTQTAPPQSEGRLVAIYYLFSGAIANYLAGVLADYTVDPTQGVGTALTYRTAYLQFSNISLALFILIMIWMFTIRFRKSRA